MKLSFDSVSTALVTAYNCGVIGDDDVSDSLSTIVRGLDSLQSLIPDNDTVKELSYQFAELQQNFFDSIQEEFK